MNNLFSLDSKFMHMLGKLTQCMILSVLWMVFSLPLVTLGAATTSLYYTVNKVIRNDTGNLWGTFWYGFRTNFKQATAIGCVALLANVALAVDLFILYQGLTAGAIYGFLSIFFLLLWAFVIMWMHYLFPYIARFTDDVKTILRNTLFMCLGYFRYSFTMLLIFLVALIVLCVMPVLPIIPMLLPALYSLLMGVMLERIFSQFMRPEDLAIQERELHD